MTSTPRLLISLATLSLGLGTACVTPHPAPHPMYNFNSVFLNGDMAGQKPWKRPDRQAIREALYGEPGTKNRPTWPRIRRQLKGRVGGVSSATGTARRSGALPNSLNAQFSGSKRGRTDALAPPSRVSGLILGDGSVRGEVVAAAVRSLGLGPAMSPNAFVQHLERTAGIVLSGKRAGSTSIAGIWRTLQTRGATYEHGDRRIVAGDLVFFDHVADINGDGSTDQLSGIGVVAEIVSDDTVVCVAPVLGAVRRVHLTPGRPSVRREGEQVLNTPVRPRRRGAGSDRPSLSGQLVQGLARI